GRGRARPVPRRCGCRCSRRRRRPGCACGIPRWVAAIIAAVAAGVAAAMPVRSAPRPALCFGTCGTATAWPDGRPGRSARLGPPPHVDARMTAPLPDRNDIRIAIIGLGYVGLPLAAAFGRRYPTVGFDI